MNKLFFINGKTDLSFFGESRRVYFADDFNTLKNIENTENAENTENTKKNKEEEQKKNLRKSLEEIFKNKYSNEALKKELDTLAGKFGKDLLSSVLEEKQFLSQKTTHQKILDILANKEADDKKKFQDLLKDKVISGSKKLEKHELNVFLAISPSEVANTLKSLPSGYLKKYYQLFSTLTSETEGVEEFVFSFVKKHKISSVLTLPKEIRYSFGELYLLLLNKKNDIDFGELKKIAKSLNLSLVNVLNENNIKNISSHSSEEREEALFADIERAFGAEKSLMHKINEIKNKNIKEQETKEKTFKMEEILEAVMHYLDEKIPKENKMTLDGISQYRAEYEIFEKMVLKASENFLIPEKKESLLAKISGKNKVLAEIQKALETNDRKLLVDSEQEKNQVSTIEQSLQNFHNNQTFGQTMILLNQKSNEIMSIVYTLKKKYPKNFQKAFKKLSEEHINISKIDLERFWTEQKDSLPFSAFLDLKEYLPVSWHNSMRILEDYIENPLLSTSQIKEPLLQKFLGEEPLLIGTKKVFQDSLSVVAGELALYYIKESAEHVLINTESELQGITDEKRMKESYSSFNSSENFKKSLQKANEYIQNILSNLPLVYSDENNPIRKSIEKSLENILKKLPNENNPQQNEDFANALKDIRSEFLKDTPSFEVDSFLSSEMGDFWKRYLSELKKKSDLISLDPEAFKREISNGQKKTLLNKIPQSSWVETSILNEKTKEKEGWPLQQELFGVMANGEGFTERGMKVLQEFIKKSRSKKGKSLFQKTTTAVERFAYILHSNGDETIQIPAELYDAVLLYQDGDIFAHFKNCGLKDVEDNVNGVWHELFHYWANTTENFKKEDKNVLPYFIEDFEKNINKILSSEKQQKFENLVQEFQKLGTHGDALEKEELFVMLGSELQKSTELRKEYLNKDHRTRNGIIDEIIDLVGENSLKSILGNSLSNLIKERNEKFPGYFDESFNNTDYNPVQKKAAFQQTGNKTDKDVEEKRITLKSLMNNDENDEKLEKKANEDDLLTNETRAEKLEKYNKKAKELRAKMEESRKQIKESGNKVPKGIESVFNNCEQILRAGAGIINNPFRIRTGDEADEIINKLSSRIEDVEDDEPEDPKKPKKKKEDKDSVEGNIDAILRGLSDFPKDNRNYFLQMWDSTEFLALGDFGTIKNTFVDYIKRRWKDQQSVRINKVGQAITPKWGWFGGLEQEFNNAKEGATATISGNYKKALENQTSSYVALTYLKDVKNQEALQAGIEFLVDKGNMDWAARGKVLGEKLKSFGSGITFVESDFDPKNERTLRLKLKKAINRVYGSEILFDSWYNKNKEANEGSVDKGDGQVRTLSYGEPQVKEWIKYASVYHANDDRDGTLRKEFYFKKQILEGYIYGILDDGDFGNPQRAMYYLIMGIAQGAIHPDAAARSWGRLVSKYPAFQYISGSSKSDFIQWQKEILWDPERQEFRKPWDNPPEWFDTWLDSKMMTSDAVVRNRMQNLKDWNMDHDNSYFVMSTGTSGLALRMLSDQMGKNKFKQMPSGSLRYFSSLALNENQVKAEESKKREGESRLRDNVIRHAGFYSSLQGIGNQEIIPENSNIRPYQFEKDMLDDVPRGTGQGYNSKMKVKDYFTAQNALFLSLKNVPGQDDGFSRFLDLVYGEGVHLTPEEFVSQWNDLYTKYPLLQQALKKSSENSIIKKKSERFFVQHVPYVLDFFLGEKKKEDPMKSISDANYAQFMKSIKNLSTGAGINGIDDSKNWGNQNASTILAHNSKYQDNGKSYSANLPEEYQKEGVLAFDINGELKGVKKVKGSSF